MKKKLNTEKEQIRLKLVEAAKQLAIIAKEKEVTRLELAKTAKKFAIIASEKEKDRLKLIETAKQLAIIAKEKETILVKFVKTAKQLASEKATQEAIFESIPGMIYVYDEQGNFIKANHNHVTMTGYSMKELHRMNPLSWYDNKADIARVKATINEVFTKGYSEVDVPMRIKNGTKPWMHFTGSKLVMNGKNYFVGVGIDITERKQAEDNLKASESKFLSAFQTSPYAITITRAKDGKFIDVNDSFFLISGITRAEALVSSSIATKLWHKQSDRQRVVADLQAGRAVVNREYEFRKKGGKVFTGLFSAKILTLNNEVCILSSIADITERKKTEESIKKEQSLTNAIIESIPGTFYVLDQTGKYVRWNAYQRDKIVGKSEEKVAETNAADTIHPDDRALIGSKITNVLVNGLEESVEGRVLMHGGPDYKWLVMTGRRMMIDGKPYLVGIGIDITERKQAEAKAKELDKLKDNFLSITTHELKTPLVPINSQAQMLLAGDYGKLNLEQEKAVEMIYRNEKHLDVLTGEVLDITKIQSNKFKIILGKAVFSTIITDSVDDLRALARANNLTISSSPFPEIPPIMVDKLRLTQLMDNLLSNAIKFTPENGKISVSVRKKNNDITVTVKDTGIGISSENLNKLFTPFFQVETNSLNRKYRGTGLGLAICKGIIEAHGGKIWAESEGEGKGSAFSFNLPIKL